MMFRSEKTLATPGALELIERTGTNLVFLLACHFGLDQGCLDREDNKANLRAVRTGARILSAYTLGEGDEQEKIWLITEAVGDDGKRAATTILLPSEY